jgi:hypothetical protein
MRVEARLVTEQATGKEGNWSSLFKPGVIRRTMIGVGVMFFQRKSLTSNGMDIDRISRMEWNQRAIILWTDAHEEHRLRGRDHLTCHVGLHQHHAITRSPSSLVPS